MKIDDKLIDKLAHLSQLDFDQKSKDKMTKDLGYILSFVNKLEELDTSDIEPMVYVSKEHTILREDIVGKHLDKKQALKNAPQKDSDYFKVPTVLKK
ncbi:MAG: Asp-tRNA(Asn)/Glu-tRNA(Gln) amidotransferase subunit GatC [Flavobacteriales bacterium]